jgi:hypothetical protein
MSSGLTVARSFDGATGAGLPPPAAGAPPPAAGVLPPPAAGVPPAGAALLPEPVDPVDPAGAALPVGAALLPLPDDPALPVGAALLPLPDDPALPVGAALLPLPDDPALPVGAALLPLPDDAALPVGAALLLPDGAALPVDAGLPVFAFVVPEAGVVAGVVAGVFLSFLSALSFGPAATVAARSNEENTTTVELARMRNLQPALAGDFARTSRRIKLDANRRFFLWNAAVVASQQSVLKLTRRRVGHLTRPWRSDEGVTTSVRARR